MSKIDQELVNIFEKKIKPHILVNEETGCWEWTRSLREGYGQFHPYGILGKNKFVHRFSYEVFNGVLNKDELVRHNCHNRKCCNPKHLLKGSHKDNWEDSKEIHQENHKKLAKKTGWWINGVRYPTSRVASNITTIPMGTLIKYTDNFGVFNIELYRESCLTKNIIPKV